MEKEAMILEESKEGDMSLERGQGKGKWCNEVVLKSYLGVEAVWHCLAEQRMVLGLISSTRNGKEQNKKQSNKCSALSKHCVR